MFARLLLLPAVQVKVMEVMAHQVIRILKRDKISLSKTALDIKYLCANACLESLSAERKGLAWWIFHTVPMRCYGVWWPFFVMKNGNRFIKPIESMSQEDMFSFLVVLAMQLQKEIDNAKAD